RRSSDLGVNLDEGGGASGRCVLNAADRTAPRRLPTLAHHRPQAAEPRSPVAVSLNAERLALIEKRRGHHRAGSVFNHLIMLALDPARLLQRWQAFTLPLLTGRAGTVGPGVNHQWSLAAHRFNTTGVVAHRSRFVRLNLLVVRLNRFQRLVWNRGVAATALAAYLSAGAVLSAAAAFRPLGRGFDR